LKGQKILNQNINWQEIKRKSKIGSISGLLAIPVIVGLLFLSPSLGIDALFYHGDRLNQLLGLLLVLPLSSFIIIGSASGYIYKSKILAITGFFVGAIPLTIVLLVAFLGYSFDKLDFAIYLSYLIAGLLVGFVVPWKGPIKIFFTCLGGLIGSVVGSIIGFVIYLTLFGIIFLPPIYGTVIWFFIALAEEKYALRFQNFNVEQ
jgi:hypothetical protein